MFLPIIGVPVESIRRALVLGLVLIAGTAFEQAPSVGPRDRLIIVLSGMPKQENIFTNSYLNRHVGRDAFGYVGVDGGMDSDTRNAEGERILEFTNRKVCHERNML